MKKETQILHLYLFSIFAAFLIYGFALTNFSLTVDSEMPVWDENPLNLGRWGAYFIRFHLFNSLLPYYTLLFGLVFLGLTGVEIIKILKIKGVFGYLFILLFLSFPQHAYQLVFTLQADAIPLGYFFAATSVSCFLHKTNSSVQRSLYKLISTLLLVCTFAINQVLIFIPFVLYILYFFTQIDKPSTVKIRQEFKKGLLFAGLFVFAILLYFLSVKLFAKQINSSYFLNSYVSGDMSNSFITLGNILIENLFGNFYYGEKPYLLTLLGTLFALILFVKDKKHYLLKIIIFLVLLVVPFGMSFFIKSGWHPPRIYVSSTLVFAFVIVYVLKRIKNVLSLNQLLFIGLTLFLWNVFYVTNLFYSQNKIFKHDLEIAKDIKQQISKIDDFIPENDYVYFYGTISESHHEKLMLPKSEIFSSSIFRWDGGNNWRIHNFFKFNDIGNYRFLDDETSYKKIKDSFAIMPEYPKKGSIKKIENVVVVKLGNEKGHTIFDFEKVNIFIPQPTVLNSESSENVIAFFDTANQQKNALDVRGWCVIEGMNSTKNKVKLLLIGNNGLTYSSNLVKEKRNDISEALKGAYNDSGFRGVIDISSLKNGEYTLGISIENEVENKIIIKENKITVNN